MEDRTAERMQSRAGESAFRVGEREIEPRDRADPQLV